MKPPENFMPQVGNFLDLDNVEVVKQAIINRFDEIVRLAQLGEPPVMALIPEFDGVIYEAIYWRFADRCIGAALGDGFEYVGTGKTSIVFHPRANVFRPNWG